MKKQNVNNKLAFGKATVTELNENQMNHVQGGSKDALIIYIITNTYGTWLNVI